MKDCVVFGTIWRFFFAFLIIIAKFPLRQFQFLFRWNFTNERSKIIHMVSAGNRKSLQWMKRHRMFWWRLSHVSDQFGKIFRNFREQNEPKNHKFSCWLLCLVSWEISSNSHFTLRPKTMQQPRSSIRMSHRDTERNSSSDNRCNQLNWNWHWQLLLILFHQINFPYDFIYQGARFCCLFYRWGFWKETQWGSFWVWVESKIDLDWFRVKSR